MRTWTIVMAAAVSIAASGPSQAGFYSNDFTSGVGTAQLRGTATLDAGSVRLTENLTGQEGSLVIGDLDHGRIVQSFDASFRIAIGPSGTPPADGVSFSFGPLPPGTYGEAGAPAGLVVTFDLFDNGETPTPPVIRVSVNGVQVAASTIPLDSGGAFRTVSIHWDANGLDLNYNAFALTFTDVAVPGFVPLAGYGFTFGARTGDATAEQRIDEVTISTASVAAPSIPTLSEGLLALLAGLLACLGAYRVSRPRRAAPTP